MAKRPPLPRVNERAPTIHRRLAALSRDPEIPGWVRWTVLAGLAVPTPLELDEAVLLPLLGAWLWFRRRHVLARHGITGVHVVGAMMVLAFLAAGVGLAVNIIGGLL